MSKLCQCGCGGTCRGECACTTNDSGALGPPSFCYHCATSEAEHTLLEIYWFLTTLRCVVNSVPDAGIAAGEAIVLPGAIGDPATAAPAGPYRWVKDPTLKSSSGRIKNAFPNPRIGIYPMGGGGPTVSTECVSGFNLPLTGGVPQTNGWHIGIGYNTSDSDLCYGSRLQYDYYPSKPPVVPLVPNVAYVYGIIRFDTNVKLGFTDGDPQRVCINATARLRGEFCLGRIPGTDPVQYKFLKYDIPVFEHDSRKPKDSFCSMTPICLPRRQTAIAPGSLASYFTGGVASLAGYKWKAIACATRSADPSTMVELHDGDSVSFASGFVVEKATSFADATITQTVNCLTETFRVSERGSFSRQCDPGSTFTVSDVGSEPETVLFRAYANTLTDIPVGGSVAAAFYASQEEEPSSFLNVEGNRLFPHREVSGCSCIELWNTGEEYTGATDSEIDSHWEKETANGSGSFVPAVIIGTQPTWVAQSGDPPQSTWIGTARLDVAGAPWDGIRLFRTKIKFPSADLIQNVRGKVACDNSALTISVNGTVVATPGGDFLAFTNFEIPASAFVVGDNEVVVEAYDFGFYGGLLVEWEKP